MYKYSFFESNTFKQHVYVRYLSYLRYLHYLRVIKQDIIKCKTFAFLAWSIVLNGGQWILYKTIEAI